MRIHSALARFIDRLDTPPAVAADVIPWGAPVPSFGNLVSSSIATVGINPSNREFVDERGNELNGAARRFHSLSSLGIDRWIDVDATHLRRILESCESYFMRNPYDGWFRKLDRILEGVGCSLYSEQSPACHLDLIPYATARKWSELTRDQQSSLLSVSSDSLVLLLRESSIETIVLNGQSVVTKFQQMVGLELTVEPMTEWSLPRAGPAVAGFAYFATVDSLMGVPLIRPLQILGYNHNLQSSFGVTTKVVTAIRDWVAEKVHSLE